MEKNYKKIAIEILQKLGKHCKQLPQNDYTKGEILKLLGKITDDARREPEVFQSLVSRFKEEEDKFTDAVLKLADALRKPAPGKRAITQLLYIYWAAVDPYQLKLSNDPFPSYFQKTNVPASHQESTLNRQTQYLFYYWNHEKNGVEIGLLKMSIKGENSESEEWDKGTIHYFLKIKSSEIITNHWKQDGDYRPVIASKRAKGLYTLTLLTGLHGDKNFALSKEIPFCNSIRILIKDKKVNDRKIMMCSYSAAIANGSKPTSGIGIIVRIGDENNSNNFPLSLNATSENYCSIFEKNDEISIVHEVPNEITNILFDRRDSLREIIVTPNNFSENQLFDSFSKLPNRSHVKAIGEIAGLYFGYHLQNNYGKTGADKKERGALRTLVLEILPSGICHLVDDEERHDSDARSYFGFLSMKDLRKKKMLINMDREYEKYIEYHSWRLQFYIKALPDGVLEGVVSGFAKTSNNPITSPVRFKKAQSFNSLAQFIELPKESNALRTIFPSTFFKSEYPLRNQHVDIDRLLAWDARAIHYFASINDNVYFNSPNQSLPHNFININFDEYSQFKGLRGNYYLVSCSHAEDNRYLSKVKVQLRNYGEAFFIYPIEHEAEKLELFIGRWEMQESGQILKVRLKYRKRGIINLTDLITSQPQSFGDFIFQLNAIENIEKIDFLKCISVWVDNEKENTLLAKREFLFPASPIDSSIDFPDDFAGPYKYKFPLSNFEDKEFFDGIKYFKDENMELNIGRRNQFLDLMKQQEGNIITVNKKGVF